MSPTAESIIAAIRKRGSDAIELRDAVHEAHHALFAGARKWDRDSIHRALRKFPRWMQAADELMARAVEQLVCKQLGVEIDGIEKWAHVSVMEAMSYRIPFMPYDDCLRGIQNALNHESAKNYAARIIALGEGR